MELAGSLVMPLWSKWIHLKLPYVGQLLLASSVSMEQSQTSTVAMQTRLKCQLKHLHNYLSGIRAMTWKRVESTLHRHDQFL